MKGMNILFFNQSRLSLYFSFENYLVHALFLICIEPVTNQCGDITCPKNCLYNLYILYGFEDRHIMLALWCDCTL